MPVTYSIHGKAQVDQGGGLTMYYIKATYKGDGTPWWVTSAGITLPVTKEFFDSKAVGDTLEITLS